MSGRVEHQHHFDPEGRLFAEHWLTIAREKIRPDFQLNAAFADQLAHAYFETVRRVNVGLYDPEFRDGGVWVHTFFGRDVLVFQNKRVDIQPQKTTVSWDITGGFMRARRVKDGGQFLIRAEWRDDGAQLKLSSALDSYAARLTEIFGRRLGAFIYDLTQGVSHQFIITKFLREQARELQIVSKPRSEKETND